jgi:hypothetical protein
MPDVRRILEHPFWSMLRLRPGGNDWVRRALAGSPAQRQRLVDAVASGFFPISCSSPLAFTRVVELARARGVEAAAALAEQIALTETGERPLVGWYLGVGHPQSFLRTLASVSACAPRPDPALGEAFLADLGVPEAELGQLVGYCETIEAIAPHTTHWITELVAQWAVLSGTSFAHLWWPYLCEHLLTEGDTSCDQHIQVVSALVDSLGEHVADAARAAGRERYVERTVRHLDRVVAAAVPAHAASAGGEVAAP